MKIPSVSLLALGLSSSFILGDAFAPSHLHLSNPSSTQSTARYATVSKIDAPPNTSVFLTPESAKACVDLAGSPVFAYSLERLRDAADACLAFPNAYGLTVRYAMKACPNAAILKYFNSRGIHIDASSGYEVRRAMAAGIPPENISLSSQELPEDFVDFVNMGVKINAWYEYG
jgi:diaminopimelate decarboxylase